MKPSRRATLLSLLASCAVASQQQHPEIMNIPPPMPTGGARSKSKEKIAEEDRAEAMKEAEELVKIAEQLRDGLKGSGVYIVTLDSLRTAKKAEKLSRRIQTLLKD